MTALVTLAWFALAAAQPAAQAQNVRLKGFEGTWVVDDPGGPDAGISVTIVRQANDLVLKADLTGREIVTRYNLSGADATNANPGIPKAVFRTRIDKQKLVTEIWINEATGPPQTIETRYLESADVMVTELSKSPGEPAFNRTVLRRKQK